MQYIPEKADLGAILRGSQDALSYSVQRNSKRGPLAVREKNSNTKYGNYRIKEREGGEEAREPREEGERGADERSEKVEQEGERDESHVRATSADRIGSAERKERERARESEGGERGRETEERSATRREGAKEEAKERRR